MEADDILENIYQFIKKHQSCEEENTIVPNVAEDTMIFRCFSCDSVMKIFSSEGEATVDHN